MLISVTLTMVVDMLFMIVVRLSLILLSPEAIGIPNTIYLIPSVVLLVKVILYTLIFSSTFHVGLETYRSHGATNIKKSQ